MPKKSLGSSDVYDDIHVEKIFPVRYFHYKCKELKTTKYWEILFVENGKISITINSDEFILSKKDIIFIEQGSTYVVNTSDMVQADIYLVSFTCGCVHMNMFRNLKIKLSGNLNNIFLLMLNEGIQLNTRQKTNSLFAGRQLTINYLEQLLINIIRSKQISDNVFIPEYSNYNNTTSEIICFLEANIYGKMSISSVCEHMHYGKTYLCALFKNSTGYTIMQYYNNLKILEAKQLILRKEFTVYQISSMLCFENQYYFSNTFKKITGITPTKYLNLL